MLAWVCLGFRQGLRIRADTRLRVSGHHPGATYPVSGARILNPCNSVIVCLLLVWGASAYRVMTLGPRIPYPGQRILKPCSQVWTQAWAQGSRAHNPSTQGPFPAKMKPFRAKTALGPRPGPGIQGTCPGTLEYTWQVMGKRHDASSS